MNKKYTILALSITVATTIYPIAHSRVQIAQLRTDLQQLLCTIDAPNVSKAKRKIKRAAHKASSNIQKLTKKNKELEHTIQTMNEAITSLTEKNLSLSNTVETLIKIKKQNESQYASIQTLIDAVPTKLPK